MTENEPQPAPLARFFLNMAARLVPPVRRLRQERDALRAELARAQAERARDRQQSCIYEALFEQTHEGVAIFDRDGICTHVNRQMCAMLGYDAAELIGTRYGSVAADKEAVEALYQRIIGGEPLPTYERPLVRKDGSVFYAEVNNVLVHDDGGQPLHVQTTVRDVSERRKTQAELSDQNLMLRTLIDSMPDFVYVKNRGSRFIIDNVAHARSVSHTPEEIVGKTDRDLFPAELAERYIADEERVMSSGQPLLNHEEPSLGEDGLPIWALTSKIPLYDNDGQIVGLVGVTRDITERKLREKQLEDSERFIQKVTDAVPDVLFVYDFENQAYRYYNDTAISRVLGYSQEEFTRTDVSFMMSIMHPDDQPAFEHWYERFAALGDDDVLETSYRLRHKNGSWRQFHSRDRVFARNAAGVPSQSIGLAQDITDTVRAEQQLRRQNEYLRALSEITPALVNRLDPSDIMRTVLARTKALMETEYVYMDMFADQTPETPGYIHIQRFEGNAYEVRPGEGVVGRVWETGATVVVEDYGNWPYRMNVTKLSDVRASIGIPLKSGDRLIGVLGASYTDAEHSFETAEIDILTRIGELASIALDNAQLFAAAQRELAERERVEAALRASEQRYRAVVESQTELICCFSPDNLLTFVNDAYCRYFHVRREDIIGRQLTRHIPDEDWVHMEPTLQKQLAGELEVMVYEHRVIAPDGELRWQQWTDRVVMDEHGSVVELQAVGRDVTERKQAEIALNAERDFVSAILTNTIALLTVTDRDGQIVTFNRACETLSGYRYQEVEGLQFWEQLLLPDEADSVRQMFARVVSGEYPIKHVNHWRLRDGSTRLIEWSNTALTDANGEVTHIVSSGVDISARQQLEERSLELAVEREKVKILGNFVRDASHDFRTPLSILNTNLYLMRRASGTDVQEPRLTEMEQQVVHLTRLIDQLLMMTRLDSGADTKLTPVSLNDVVQNVAASLQGSIKEKQQTLELALADALPAVRADAWQLNQALRNILVNAVQYTPSGGSIRMETAADDGNVVVRIIDTGVGIEAVDLPHIFERFYRADKARTGGEAGTGLGLAISRKILDLHAGTITVNSTPGQGTVFTIAIPAAAVITDGVKNE